MGFRDSLRSVVSSIRAIPGRDFEIRPYTVAVVTRAWSGTHPGEGLETVSTTPITEADGQPPKVRFLNDEQRALADGLPMGSVEVGPITPDFPGGGTTWAALSGSGTTAGNSFHYLLTGPRFPSGARYRFVGGRSDKTFGYRVTLAPMSEA
jgi:hypothetical protein